MRKLRHPSLNKWIRVGIAGQFMLQEDTLKEYKSAYMKGYEDGYAKCKELISQNTQIASCQKIVPELMTIDEIGFSNRTYNCLRRFGIENSHEIATLSYTELISIRNFGKKCMEEVISKMHDLGYDVSKWTKS